MAIIYDELKKLTYSFSYGVYIITAGNQQDYAGMTAVWVTQASKDPVSVAIGVTPTGKTAELIAKHKKFTVNVLAKSQSQLAYQFGGATDEPKSKFNGIPFSFSPDGLPVLTDAICWMECEVEHSIDLNTHQLIIGKVICGESISDAEPAIYLNGKIS